MDLLKIRNILESTESLVVYDIGASTGSWTKELSEIFPKYKYFLFEPNEKYEKLNLEADHSWHKVYLSDCVKDIDFYYMSNTGDSYYKEVTGYYDNCKPISIKTINLDSYVLNNNLPMPNIIKIDTQGSELDIFKGANMCIENAFVLIVELSLVKYNLDAPSMSETIQYLVEKGYMPYCVLQEQRAYNNNENALIQQDIVFVKMPYFSNMFK